MQRIIFIPLDERPCNLQYPAYIGAISGLDIVFPPRELLGDFKRPLMSTVFGCGSKVRRPRPHKSYSRWICSSTEASCRHDCTI